MISSRKQGILSSPIGVALLIKRFPGREGLPPVLLSMKTIDKVSNVVFTWKIVTQLRAEQSEEKSS